MARIAKVHKIESEKQMALFEDLDKPKIFKT